MCSPQPIPFMRVIFGSLFLWAGPWLISPANDAGERPTPQAAQTAAEKEEKIITQLIPRLFAADAVRRETAIDALANFPTAVGRLLKYRVSANAEQRMVIDQALRRIRAAHARYAIEEAKKRPEDVEIDLFVDRQLAAAEAGLMQPGWWDAAMGIGDLRLRALRSGALVNLNTPVSQ